MTTLGAIRWDAWYGMDVNSPARYTAGTLSPNRWHSRVPLHGVVSNNKVSWADSQATMDAEIAAAKTCLNYWAFLKYPVGSLSTGWNWFQSSTHKADINWCWIHQTSQLGTTGNYTTQVNLVVTQMQQSNYQKVLTNRPLMYLYYTDSDLATYWGGSNANLKAALDAIRTGIQAAGLGDAYIVLMRTDPTSTATLKTTLGCNAITSYIPPAPTTIDTTYASFDTSIQAYWATMAGTGAKIVPIGSMGWAQQPRIEIVNPYVTNKPYFGSRRSVALPTNSEITAHIAAGYAYIAANPLPCEAGTMLFYAWNEHDEGGWIAPTYGDPTGLRCAAVNAGRS